MNIQKFAASSVIAMALGALLVACSPPAVSSVTPSPSRPLETHTVPAAPVPTAKSTEAPIFQKFDVGGWSLDLVCSPGAAPVVVMDSGLDVDYQVWSKVFNKVKDFARVCVYNRANIGTSDPAPKPRTSRQMVKELHTLLARANVRPPYILVGWSIGGFNMRVYAGEYPQEVVGLVLLDPTHPDEDARYPSALPQALPNENNCIKGLREEAKFFRDYTQNQEGMDLAASAAQVRASGSLGALPLVVVTAGKSPCSGLWSEDAESKFQALQVQLHKEIVALSPNGTQMIATNSQHCIPCDEPELVIDVVHTMTNRVRGK
jgi:pimeloyl-ACP methyl ester carboxylesterase